MFEMIINFFNQIKSMWSKWTMVQRLMLAGIAAASVIAVIALVSVSSSPGMVPVIDTPIKEEDRDRIITRINSEGIKTSVSADGVISVPDELSASKMRAILSREGMLPKGTDPWSFLNMERWTTREFEDQENIRLAVAKNLEQTIKSLDDIDNAKVDFTKPAQSLFRAEQNPYTAYVVITPKFGSDIIENRKQIEGVQKIIIAAVGNGIKAENIVITDNHGVVLNDFENMKDFDRVALIEKGDKFKKSKEAELRAGTLNALQQIFSQDRVRDLNVKIDIDMSKKTVESSQYKPIMLKERTPGLAYDDSERTISATLSESTSETAWEGTGFNPEGPAGVEGQTPPAFKDMTNLQGKVTQKTRTHNEVFNEEKIQEERDPEIKRVTASVNIDGTWKIKHDEKGSIIFNPNGSVEREYVAVTPEDLAQARALVEGAIGYNAARGDTVNVQNIQIDRSAQFADEDKAMLRQRQIQLTVIASLIGIAVLLIGFVVFHIVSRAREQARRRREEELARQHELMRQQAMLDADKEGQEVSLSVEDQARLELLEKSMNLAREHPQDVSQLIRTWLMEE